MGMIGVADLEVLPAKAEEVCDLAEAWARDWVPGLGARIDERRADTPDDDVASGDLAAGPPTALRWAYRSFGTDGRALFRQDPLRPVEQLRPDVGGVVPFRAEQQGCEAWGFPADDDRDDPPVLITWPDAQGWRPFQERLSVHLLEGVLSEAMVTEGAISLQLQATDEALQALDGLGRLGIPEHHLGSAPDAGPVRWHAFPEVVVRNDADSWLWALARTEEDAEQLEERVPGDWRRLGG